jgi:hypothetical protein
VASFGGVSGKPEHQFRYAGFVVARFGDTIVEWSTTSYAFDDSPPEVDARVALMRSVVSRTDALVPDSSPVTTESFGLMHREGLPAVGELGITGNGLPQVPADMSGHCDMGAGRGMKGSQSTSRGRFLVMGTSGDAEWRLSVASASARVTIESGVGREASYIWHSGEGSRPFGSGEVRRGPLLVRADFDATFVREPDRPQTIPGLPPEIKVSGAIICGPPVK